VYVQARNKRFDQKGTFTIKNGDVWDEETIRRLEELCLRSDALKQAREETEREIKRSQPTTVHSIDERKRWLSGKEPRDRAMLERYFEGSDDLERSKWLARCDEARIQANRSYTEIQAELFSFETEMANHERLPALLGRVVPLECEDDDERTYALYRSAVWCSERELKPEQWQILVDNFLEREDAELAAALTPLAPGGESETIRLRIPPEVRRAVWIRDQGKCARCGSRERLEYDHIVPVSRGGSNTERNIELLCEFHNRAKSNNIS